MTSRKIAGKERDGGEKRGGGGSGAVGGCEGLDV